MNPQFPLYIVSKGRADTRITSKALEEIKVPYYIVIEEQEYKAYSEFIHRDKILILDKKYQREYNTFDDLGDSKSKGPGAARNFAWDHSISNGFEWHWVMDDNISDFYRAHKNQIIRCGDGTLFACMEDFILRYENIGMAGPNYEMFVLRKQKLPPFVCNTRIYSCNFIRNDLPFRWRGRYNEDTDLSLRILKSGLCTVQFNAFLQKKLSTQLIKGGNTDAFYAKDGTLPKSEMQVAMHPDVSKLVWKFGRHHHHVDYAPFKKIKLIRRTDIDIPITPNNYGMRLVNVS